MSQSLPRPAPAPRPLPRERPVTCHGLRSDREGVKARWPAGDTGAFSA